MKQWLEMVSSSNKRFQPRPPTNNQTGDRYHRG
jgi:hypothetical protein